MFMKLNYIINSVYLWIVIMDLSIEDKLSKIEIEMIDKDITFS